MILVYAFTLWLSFGSFLLFPHLGLPRFMARAAITLFYAELFFCIAHDYAGPETAAGQVLGQIAGYDLPGLTALLFVLAGATALRRHRAAQRSPDIAVEHRQHVLATDGPEAHDPPALPLGPQRDG